MSTRTQPPLQTETADFRTYQPETVKGPDGKLHTLQLCEEWVEGRWEPFMAILKVHA
jgi:hypothetical protein